MIIWWLSLVYVIAVIFAGIFMYRYCDIPGYELNTQKQYVIFKMLASCVFLCIGLIAFIYSKNWLYFFIAPAAILCAVGDLFLAISHEIDDKVKNPKFIIGVIAFTAAQLIFSFNFFMMLDFRISWTLVIPFIVLGYSIFCMKSQEYEYGANGIPCAIYGFFVGLSAALGLQLIITYPHDIISVFLGIGAILFLVSDSILNMKLFWKRYTPWAVAGVLIFYFGAMWFYSTAIIMYI